MGQVFIIFAFSIIFLYVTTSVVNGIRIGALLEDYRENEFVFNYGVEYLNNRSRIIRGQPKLDPIMHKISYGNEFEASQRLCQILRRGVAAIFGPLSPDSGNFVQSVCDEKEVPLLQFTPNSNLDMPVVNLYPHPDTLADALLDIIQAYDWKSFTILYESAQWLPRVSNLLKLYDSKGYTITVRQLSLQINNNYRAVLKRVKNSKDNHIVIECSLDSLPDVLQQAQQVGLMTEHHQFIVTNLDMHTIDLEPYTYSGTNITGIRIIDPEDPFVKDVTTKWGEHFLFKEKFSRQEEENNFENEDDYDGGNDDNDEEDDGDGDDGQNGYNENQNQGNVNSNPGGYDENFNIDGNDEEQQEELEVLKELTPEFLRTDTALIYDGLLLFIEAIKQLKGIHQFKPISLRCDETETWKNGYSIVNYMRMSTIRGLSKVIKFDREGHRKDFNLDVIELTSSGISKVGTWSSGEGLTVLRPDSGMKSHKDYGSMKNVSLIVITALSHPYGMLKESSHQLTGNDRFEGFGIELIEKLSELLGFNYTFTLQKDLDYGKQIPGTDQWTGMIGELRAGRADLAITDLTITADREAAVDFTMPFMNLGISILYKKATKQPPAFFSFMSPFSKEVWMYLGMGYLGVSLCLFILGRISPNEWDNPYPCIEEPEVLENQFSFRNAMWFAIGALLQQGTELAPKTPSTRTIASIWWFFTLIMVSSYTANLAAFLTVETPFSPINSATELANKNGEIMYGAKQGGSTFNFFRDADVKIYQKMYDYMSKHPDLQPGSNEAGLKMVKESNYAFLMESTSIEYMIERNCNVDQVGQNLDNKGYGIAMRKNYEYRGILSETVLRLQEQGKLTEMKIKWWKEKRGGGSCSDTSGEGGAVALGIENVGGVFVLLITGALTAILISFCECIYDIKSRSQEFKKKAGGENANELEMENVGGVFLVLIAGSFGAFIYGIFEWLCDVRKRALINKVPFKDEFIAEFKFVVKCQGNTKTVRHRKSSSTDSRQSAISEGRSNMSRTSKSPARESKHKSKPRDEFIEA